MNIKRILALLMALLLTMTAFACAETAPAATEETPAHNYEVITDPVIITYGDREIHVSEAMSLFMDYYQTLAGYESYGLSAGSFVERIKESVLAEMTQKLIEEVKITELGYDQFTEEEQAEINAQVESTFSDIYLYYYDYFSYNSQPGTDIDAQVQEVLEYYNYTKEDLQVQLENSYAASKMATDLTKDITVTEEDVAAYYNTFVMEDQEAYAKNFTAYEEARTYGTDEMICWNPEGYRRVLQVLIPYSEEEQAEYAALQAELDVLTGVTLADENNPPTHTYDEIKTRMKEISDPLLPVAGEVTDKFNSGVSIEDLMAEYNADTGIPAEGYYVNIQSTMWDGAFVDAAFSVNEIGQLSAPYAGQYGLYMVYYLADVPAGVVDMEQYRATLEEDCLSQKQRAAYFEQLTTWKEELGIETHIDMFITGYEG